MNLLTEEDIEDRLESAMLATPKNSLADKKKLYSVTEIFNAMQGEGPVAGQRTVFIRLHFCDGDGYGHWCSWCDTRYTWDTDDPGFHNYTRMTAAEIVCKVSELYGVDPENQDKVYPTRTVTISGGNPVMQLDDELIDLLHAANYQIQVETQGTILKPFLNKCEQIVVSPKPPSSGMDSLSVDKIRDWCRLGLFYNCKVSFKIVVFDQPDFDWASWVYSVVTDAVDGVPIYLQAGTPQRTPDIISDVLTSYRWLVEYWLQSGKMEKAILLPQLHVLVWGAKKGV